MNKQRLEQVEERIMKELDFYDDKKNIGIMKNRIDISLVVNKLANTIIQSENIIERAKQNEINSKENQRLIERFKNGKQG